MFLVLFESTLILTENAMSVSYTNLDVYKRQEDTEKEVGEQEQEIKII